jgi:hypothetical protein
LREIVVAGRRAWDVSEVTISPLAGHGRVLAAGWLGLGEVTILGRGPDHCSAERIRVRRNRIGRGHPVAWRRKRWSACSATPKGARFPRLRVDAHHSELRDGDSGPAANKWLNHLVRSRRRLAPIGAKSPCSD